MTRLRLAQPGDAPAIAGLMHASALELFRTCYDEQQTASATVHLAAVDLPVIEDGTYFVHEAAGEILACGGWSRRNKLFNASAAGSDDRLLDPATEPARIRAMFVRADRTRRGLARAILDASAAAARAEGFRRLALMATLSGVAMYTAYGFTADEQVDLTLPDGVVLGMVAMSCPL